MAIAEQFAGLQMDQLIGAPLRAAVDASLQLADSTADFIRRAGFDGCKLSRRMTKNKKSEIGRAHV